MCSVCSGVHTLYSIIHLSVPAENFSLCKGFGSALLSFLGLAGGAAGRLDLLEVALKVRHCRGLPPSLCSVRYLSKHAGGSLIWVRRLTALCRLMAVSLLSLIVLC